MFSIKNLIDDTIKYFKDVEIELKRITWPTIKESVRSTMAVIVISLILATFLGSVDFVFSWMVNFVLS